MLNKDHFVMLGAATINGEYSARRAYNTRGVMIASY